MVRRFIELQRQCWTQSRIAEETGYCEKTIWFYLKRHNEKVYERLTQEGAAIKANQIARLEWIAAEAVKAWEQSKKDAETIKSITRKPKFRSDRRPPKDAAEKEVQTEVTIQHRTGDPRYLAEARTALADIRRVMRLNDDDSPADIESMTRDELQAYVNRSTRSRRPKTP